ncbi:hypothetical protein H7J07_06755 [Mycobacterium koreense]|nr:hypothetical protein [Mycolicibacillus koreensis]MCV7247919.1 hypothetical protein [Mycolicibacillus koreensis]BBY56162.1 hypothetical protein MKOR_34130 [Mycolicibacillus koreensis]
MARQKYTHQQQMHLWKRNLDQQDRLARDFQRDQEKAEIEVEKAEEKSEGIAEKARSDARAAASRVDSEFAAEEKRLLTQPRTVYTGATASVTSPVWVWHWRTVLPPSLARTLGIQRTGAGPLAALFPGGGLSPSASVPDLIVGERPELGSDPDFVEWAEGVARIWKSEIESRYGVLKRLRDDDWWAQLAEAAGVTNSVSDTEQMSGTYGTYDRKVTLVSVPTLGEVVIERTGLTLTYLHRTGDTRERWTKAVPALRTGFKSAGMNAENLRVVEDSSGNLTLRFDDVDPFAGSTPTSGEFDTARGRSLLGVTSDGHEAWITWSGSSGMVVGGVPGSGKTASLLPVFAGMRDAAELHVFDGKSGFDMHPLRHIARTYDRSGDVGAPLETLRRMEELRSQRAEAMYSAAKANNYWNMEQKTRNRLGLKPVFVILDECQTWLDQSGMDKDEKSLSSEITRLIRTLVQKGRSVGIIVVLTTQKPDAVSIPTVIRDNSALKICFRVSTPEQGITVLGRQSPGAPDPTEILMSTKGRGVMETEGQGIVLFQAGYAAPDELEAQLLDAEPVEDQTVVVARLLGRRAPRVEQPVIEEVEEPVVETPEPTPEPERKTSPSLSDLTDLTEDELWEELRRRQSPSETNEPETEEKTEPETEDESEPEHQDDETEEYTL